MGVGPFGGPLSDQKGWTMPKDITEGVIRNTSKGPLMDLIDETLEVPDDLDLEELSLTDLRKFAILNLDSINEARNSASEQKSSAVPVEEKRRRLDPSVDLYGGRHIDRV